MSSASIPSRSGAAQPAPAVSPRPHVVRPGGRKPSRIGLWLTLAVLATALGAGYYLKKRRDTAAQTRTAAVTSIRTVVAGSGDVRRTVRLTGTVQAEQFAALIAPRLRGSRGGGAGSGNAQTSVSSTTGTQAQSVNTSTTSGGSSSPSLGGSSSASGPTDPNAGQNTSSLGAKRGTTNRFSDRTAAASSASKSAASSTPASSSSSSSGSDSSGSLSGGGRGRGGGGGYGMSEFMLILTQCAKGGSFVHKGDVVAEFDRQYMLLRLDDYRAGVAQLEANIKKMKAELVVQMKAHAEQVKTAKGILDKALLDLKTAEVRSTIDQERLKLAVEEAKAQYSEMAEETAMVETSQRAQIRAAEIDYEQGKIELRRAETNADRMVMKAPIDGIVVMQTLFRGGDMGQVQQGDQIYPGMFFMSIVDPRSMVVNAAVNQVDSETMRIGQKGTVRFDAFPGLELPATVTGIGAMTKAGGWRASYVREIPVRLKLDQMDPRVIPDLSASADVMLESERADVMVPREGIFQDGPDGSPFVFLRGPEGWTRREVELGLSSNVAVAVRSGLRKGDVIAAERPL